MKIKGRLIATLAALGLLIAMLPIGPASAAVGTVGITGGGFDGKFFSDQTGFNVVTLSVTDQDLSPARVGYARFTYSTSGTPDDFDLKVQPIDPAGTMVLAGEKARSTRLDGTLYAHNATYADADDPTREEALMSARWRST